MLLLDHWPFLWTAFFWQTPHNFPPWTCKAGEPQVNFMAAALWGCHGSYCRWCLTPYYRTDTGGRGTTDCHQTVWERCPAATDTERAREGKREREGEGRRRRRSEESKRERVFGVRGSVRLTGEAPAPRFESHRRETLPLLAATLSQSLQLQIQTFQVPNLNNITKSEYSTRIHKWPRTYLQMNNNNNVAL